MPGAGHAAAAEESDEDTQADLTVRNLVEAAKAIGIAGDEQLRRVMLYDEGVLLRRAGRFESPRFYPEQIASVRRRDGRLRRRRDSHRRIVEPDPSDPGRRQTDCQSSLAAAREARPMP